MDNFFICAGCVILMPIVAILGLRSKKKHKPHKEFIDSPHIHPIENYSMSKPRR